MESIIKIVKSLKKSRLLIREFSETKKQKGRILSMLLGK